MVKTTNVLIKAIFVGEKIVVIIIITIQIPKEADTITMETMVETILIIMEMVVMVVLEETLTKILPPERKCSNFNCTFE